MSRVGPQGKERLFQVEGKWKNMSWAQPYIKIRSARERGKNLSFQEQVLYDGGGELSSGEKESWDRNQDSPLLLILVTKDDNFETII